MSGYVHIKSELEIDIGAGAFRRLNTFVAASSLTCLLYRFADFFRHDALVVCAPKTC